MNYQLNITNRGKDVWHLQEFVVTQGINLTYGIDGIFGRATEDSLKFYQLSKGLLDTGVFSDSTIDQALSDGFPFDPRFVKSDFNIGYDYPRRPSGLSSPRSDDMDTMFGRFDFTLDPSDPRGEKIIMDQTWKDDNLRVIKIPQLVGSLIPIEDGFHYHSSGRIRCHRLAVDKFKALFQAWEDADLMKRIIVYSGTFNGRMKRGRGGSTERKHLSNHSWGTAIDINSITNGLGTTPPVVGERGCLRELAYIANQIGFYWGGHYNSRPDGMHFELAEI